MTSRFYPLIAILGTVLPYACFLPGGCAFGLHGGTASGYETALDPCCCASDSGCLSSAPALSLCQGVEVGLNVIQSCVQ